MGQVPTPIPDPSATAEQRKRVLRGLAVALEDHKANGFSEEQAFELVAIEWRCTLDKLSL